MRPSTSSSSSADTRSVLLRMITSAKAIWFLASGASLSRSLSHLASATVTTASSLVLRPTFSSTKKVCATGAGSARPVVSTMMASNLPLRRISPSMMRTRSPRTVQQMQPLFISNTSSSAPDHEVVVDADLAEFVDDDGVFLAVRLGQDAVEQRGLAGAEIAGEHGDGNFVGHRSLRCGRNIGAQARNTKPKVRRRESRYCTPCAVGRAVLRFANSRRTPRGVRKRMSEAQREAAMLIGSLLRTAIAVFALLLAQADRLAIGRSRRRRGARRTGHLGRGRRDGRRDRQRQEGRLDHHGQRGQRRAGPLQLPGRPAGARRTTRSRSAPPATTSTAPDSGRRRRRHAPPPSISSCARPATSASSSPMPNG